MKRRMPICEIVDTSTGSGKLLPGLNRNLTPAQQIIYIYGPNQWKTQNNVDLIEKAGSDYLITPGIAAHKLHIRKLTWNKARKACIQEGGKFLTRIVFNEVTHRMPCFCNSLSNEDAQKLINN